MKKSLKKYSLFFFFFFIFIIYRNHFSYSFEKLGGIYAIIGDEIILDSEIKTKNQKNCLDDLLIEKLMLYHAKKDSSIQIIDQELELKTQELFSEMSNKYADQEEFLIQFRKKNFIQKLTETVKNHQYIEKFYQKITDNIEISPQEVKYFFTKNKNKIPFVPKKMYISYIVFYPKLSQINRKKITDSLKKIKKEIHSDMDFSIQAILFSEENYSAWNGGLIQGIKINRLSKEFKRVVLSLSEEEISEPFETDLGFHLIKLNKKRNDEVDIRHILIKPKYTKDELRETKSFVDSIKKRIENLNFENLMNKEKDNQIVNYSIWNNIWVEENQLSKNMKKTLDILKKGKISNPYQEIVNGKEAFFIVKLLDSIPSHPISFETDYTRLKTLVKDMKKKDIIKNWAKKTLKKTYIKCP
ncbi:peptidylprolyl isomerase [Blattabacterium cuenoti]|uniref:peptidylprolyl isomerase n=1 Tax=Blattabacterium cuenoti TaxID=1653831 RepID=UPI00163B8914|nr:peptidylprolyl isomerase [Blattabacterium cuenoti]